MRFYKHKIEEKDFRSGFIREKALELELEYFKTMEDDAWQLASVVNHGGNICKYYWVQLEDQP